MNIFKIISTISFLLFSIVAIAAPSEDGKKIFLSRCSGCHSINQKVVGPALTGVDARHEIDWIIKFVQSSQTMITKGDKDAVALFGRFNNVIMPDHPDLTSDNILSIVSYIKTETEKRPHENTKTTGKNSFSINAIINLYKSNIFLSLTSLLALCFLPITIWLVNYTMSVKRKLKASRME